MLETILIVVIGLGVFLIGLAVIWNRVAYNWLSKVCSAIVISLPFERVPSLAVAGVNVRISQLLVLAGLLFWIILLARRDTELMVHKINRFSWLIPVFVILTIPSWFVVVNPTRFISTTIATWIAFGALFLISNFTINIWRQLNNLIISMLLAGIFAVYQFVGDMFLNLPTFLTGLREQYTKVVFGYPRIQSTALEPLYFAGMLFLPIIFCLILILNQQKLDLNTHFVWLNKKLKLFNQPWIVISFFVILFILTISKGAWASLIIALPVLIAINIQNFRLVFDQILNWFQSVYNRLGRVGFGFILLGTAVFSLIFGGSIIPILAGTWNHLVETVSGEAGTILERQSFVSAALATLPGNSVIGIGSGQYGVYAANLLNLGNYDGFLIVNNVYLEVWLEQGFVALAVFGLLLITPIWAGLTVIFDKTKVLGQKKLIILQTLTVTLVAYLIQWTTFSPIFIMPIFIILGLLSRALEIEEL